MGLADVRQKLESSVLLYKKKPVLFQKVNENLTEARIFDMMAQKEEVVPFDEKEFQPPVPRIGMINIAGSVVYAKRIPIRRNKLGLSNENLIVELLENAVYPDKIERARDEIRGLKSKALAETLLKKYPTLRQAFRKLSQFDGTIAFDKQFAVTSDQKLLYKHKVVGTHDFENLYLNDGFHHLEILVNV